MAGSHSLGCVEGFCQEGEGVDFRVGLRRVFAGMAEDDCRSFFLVSWFGGDYGERDGEMGEFDHAYWMRRRGGGEQKRSCPRLGIRQRSSSPLQHCVLLLELRRVALLSRPLSVPGGSLCRMQVACSSG